MDLNLWWTSVTGQEILQVGEVWYLLLSKEVTEVRDCVLGVPDQEVLRLLTVVLLAVDVRKNGRYLTVYRLVVLVARATVANGPEARGKAYRHPR